jgi:hypothetical protein
MDAWCNDRLECLFLFGELKGQDSTIWYGKYLITCKSSLGIQTYTVNIDKNISSKDRIYCTHILMFCGKQRNIQSIVTTSIKQ